jgi:YidC/Oxa1 family membrane protein insertase
MIAENQKKAQKKREKHGAPAKEINKMATTSTRNAGKVTKGQSGISESERDSKIQEAQARAQKAKPGSLTSKANLVSRYNQGLETAEPKVESAEKDSKKKKKK